MRHAIGLGYRLYPAGSDEPHSAKSRRRASTLTSALGAPAGESPTRA